MESSVLTFRIRLDAIVRATASCITGDSWVVFHVFPAERTGSLTVDFICTPKEKLHARCTVHDNGGAAIVSIRAIVCHRSAIHVTLLQTSWAPITLARRPCSMKRKGQKTVMNSHFPSVEQRVAASNLWRYKWIIQELVGGRIPVKVMIFIYEAALDAKIIWRPVVE